MDTQTQRLSALEVGNAVRFAQADFKRELRKTDAPDALRRVADLLGEGDAGTVSRFKLGPLLRAIPRMGEVRLRRVMVGSGVPAYYLERRLESVPLRVRCLLITELLRQADKIERSRGEKSGGTAVA